MGTLLILWGYIKRLGGWLTSNPLVALILGLLGALGIEAARRKLAQSKVNKLESQARRAEVERRVEGRSEAIEAARTEGDTAEAEIEASEGRDEALRNEQADIMADREWIAQKYGKPKEKKWPTR